MNKLGKQDELILKNAFTFWDKLSKTEKDLLLENAANVHYEKGENIHSADNDCIGVLVIKSGELRTYILSEEGKEITLYRMSEGEVCILSASCLIKNINFDVYIDAESETDVLLINSYVFSKLQSENVYVENFALHTTVDKFSDVMWAIQQILFLSFDKRLAAFLIDESIRTNSNDIKLTHEQIAKYMGSAREVVTRMLQHFENDGIVALYRGGLTIKDKQKMRDKI